MSICRSQRLDPCICILARFLPMHTRSRFIVQNSLASAWFRLHAKQKGQARRGTGKESIRTLHHYGYQSLTFRKHSRMSQLSLLDITTPGQRFEIKGCVDVQVTRNIIFGLETGLETEEQRLGLKSACIDAETTRGS